MTSLLILRTLWSKRSEPEMTFTACHTKTLEWMDVGWAHIVKYICTGSRILCYIPASITATTNTCRLLLYRRRIHPFLTQGQHRFFYLLIEVCFLVSSVSVCTTGGCWCGSEPLSCQNQSLATRFSNFYGHDDSGRDFGWGWWRNLRKKRREWMNKKLQVKNKSGTDF